MKNSKVEPPNILPSGGLVEGGSQLSVIPEGLLPAPISYLMQWFSDWRLRCTNV